MKLIYISFLLLIYGCSNSNTGSSIPVDNKINYHLAIIGSSTSACAGPQNADSCYVNRIADYYKERGISITVSNFAVGGTDPYQAMPSGYIPPAGRPSTNESKNITAAINSKPDVILVNFPSNHYCEYSVSEIMHCLRIFNKAAKEAGIPCFITTTQPRSEGCFLRDSVKMKMAALKDSIMQQFDRYAIDFYTKTKGSDSLILPLYNSGDNIHLNNAGHRILAQQVIEKKIFKE